MSRIRDVSSVPLSGTAYVDHRPAIASGDVRRLELIDARQSVARRPIGANVPPGPSDDAIEADEREHPPRILDASLVVGEEHDVTVGIEQRPRPRRERRAE